MKGFFVCRPALGPTHLPVQWVPGALSPGVMWPGREVDHSPPCSAEVKKAWCLVKHRENFAFIGALTFCQFSVRRKA
jgi:hypothetical protein